jgi:hypothetical protein
VDKNECGDKERGRRHMRGGGLRKEGGLFFGRVLLDLGICWESLSSVVGKDQYGGAPVCWGFWARGPGFLMVSWS